MTSPKPPGQERERIGLRFVSDAVKRDHRTLEKLYASLTDDTARGPDDGFANGLDGHDGSQREQLLEQRFCWELARHLVAMSLFIFPGTSQRARQGNQNAKDRQRGFALLRAKLLDLVDAATADGGEEDSSEGRGFRGCLARLREDLARHIKDVERTDLVAIEKVLSGEESERLARDFEATVLFIPPEVREEELEGSYGDVTAPFESVGALLDASVQELKDVLESFPRN